MSGPATAASIAASIKTNRRWRRYRLTTFGLASIRGTTRRITLRWRASIAICEGSNLAGIDPVTGALTELFHPRQHQWHEHFQVEGPFIMGKTAIGRTTILVLNINSDDQIALRQVVPLKDD